MRLDHVETMSAILNCLVGAVMQKSCIKHMTKSNIQLPTSGLKSANSRYLQESMAAHAEFIHKKTAFRLL